MNFGRVWRRRDILNRVPTVGLILIMLLQLASSVVLFSVQEAQANPDPGWLSGWSYRKLHNLTGASGAGTDYQMKVVVHSGSGSDSGEDVYLNDKCTDFPNDILFTDDDGTTQLSHWLESSDANTATFWVKVNDDLGSNQSIYIYYGKSGQSSQSDGNATFAFFEDWSDNNFDKWTSYGQNTPVHTSGYYSIYIGTGSYYGLACKYGGRCVNYASRYAQSWTRKDLSSGYAKKVIIYAQVNYGYGSYGLQSNERCYFTTASGDAVIFTTGHHSTDWERQEHSMTSEQTYFNIRNVDGSVANYGIHFSVDLVAVRKYIYPEPSHGSWGGEEETPSGWIGGGTYPVDIYYEDPGGGSDLDKCEYTTDSGTSPSCPTNGTWNSACSCSGLSTTTCPVTISVGSTGDCNVDGEGACKICSKATDGAGNTGYGELSLDVDFSAPTTTISPDGKDWGNADVGFTLTCTDSHSGCQKTEYKIIDSTQSCDTTNLTEGTSGTVTCPTDTVCQKKVCFRSQDVAGNIESIQTSDLFKIDKEKPTSIYIDPTPPAGSEVTADFNLYVDDSDGTGSGFTTDSCRYTVYDSGVGTTPTRQATRTCDGSFTVTVGEGQDCRTEGGTCTVVVYAIDKVGNTGDGTVRSYNIRIDFTPPITTISPDGEDWGNSDVDFTLSCDDGTGSGCQTTEYKMIDQSQTCDTSNLITGTSGTVTCPTDQTCQKKVCYRSTDNIGNVELIKTSNIFKIDKEKPTSIYIDPTPPAGSEVTADFTLYVDDNDFTGSGFTADSCRYTVYDSGVGVTPTKQATRTCDGSFVVTVGSGKDCRTEGGTCTVIVYAIDKVGNTGDGSARSYNIRIDTTPPTITINTPTGRWYNSNPLLDVDFADDKALDDGFYQVDSYAGAWTAVFTDNAGTSYTTDFKIADSTWNGFADGSSQTIYFKATDDVGNITGADGSKSLIIKKDISVPTVSVIGAPASWQNTDATASVSCSDTHSGCDSATYKLKTYTANPGTCSTNYADYTLVSPQTISSHLWVCGAARDLVGNAGFSSPVEFKIDKEKPVSLITNPPAGSTQTADFNVTVTDTDTGDSGLNTSACFYRTYDSGVGWTREWTTRTCNSTQLITVGAGKDCQTENGTCTVYVYSYDNAGNQSDTSLRSFTIRIDLTPPTITINTFSDQWHKENPLLDVDFSDDKALDDGFYQVDSYSGAWTTIFTDNSGTSYTANFKIADSTWNGFADGSSHTIYFKAADDAGNVTGADGSKSLVIKKDVSVPTVTVTGAPVSWQNTDATANVSCTDSLSGCDSATYKLKTYTSNPGTCSTTYADYTLTSPQTISSHLWACGTAKDVAGNAGFSSPVEFKVDKTKPVSQITAPPAGSTQTADFNVTVSDTDTGDSGINTAACYYRPYDSGVGYTRAWTLRTCNSNQLITVGAGKDCQTENGTCSVYVYSYDNAGNQSDTNLRSFTIRIDTTPPTIIINAPSGLWYSSNPLLDVDFSDDKALDDGFYQVDSYTGTWVAIFADNTGTSYTTDFKIADATWNGFADGSSHTIYFKATDDAGNVTGADGSKSLVIKKDVSGPTTTISPDGKDWGNADVGFTLNCDDGIGSGCQTTEYKIIEQNQTCNTSDLTEGTLGTVTCPENQTCQKKVCFRSIDNLDNEESINTSDLFKIDKESPLVGAISPTVCQVNVSTTFSANISDNVEVINCWLYIDGANDGGMSFSQSPCSNCVASKNHTFTSIGEYFLYTLCLDEAGNPAGGPPVTVTVTEFAPLACDINIPGTGITNQWISINVSGSQGAIVEVRFASNLIGEPAGSWTYWYDWDVSSGDWDASSKIMKWSFAEAGNYEVWVELKDGSDNTKDCYDTILIMECYSGQTKTCISSQSCSHTITCQPNGTWPSCPTDTCTANAPDSPQCPCSGVDGCFGNDYYDFSQYGDCSANCTCNVDTAVGQPCAPTIYSYDPRCVGQDQCNSDADCDDGNPCTNNWCERPGDPDSVCRRDNLAEGISCGICKKCDGNGNCISRPDGYDAGECGTGCQRCVYGSCGDYSQSCDPVGNNEASCECRSDYCIDCSDTYGEFCGYRGICHCGPSEKPVWSCSNWQCSCVCQEDPACEWEEPDGYPEVIIFPPAQEGDPGEVLPYEVTVINPSEEEVTLIVTVSVPPDWEYWLDSSGTVEVTIGPGQSVEIPLRVRSPEESLPSGEYIISVTAQNSEAPEYFGTGYTIYEIPNQPPSRPEIPTEYLDWNHCSRQGISIPIFYWIYSDPEGDDQAAYEIVIEDTPDWSDLVERSSHSYNPEYRLSEWRAWMLWNTNYDWKVRVKDKGSQNWSEWSNLTQFTTPLHAGPWPKFTPSPDRVSLNQAVIFEDNSKCYTSPGNTEFNCRDLPVPSYDWDFDYIEPIFDVNATTKGSATTSYGEIGNYKIKLRITDDIDVCYSETENLTVTLPLPEWWEITPF